MSKLQAPDDSPATAGWSEAEPQEMHKKWTASQEVVVESRWDRIGVGRALAPPPSEPDGRYSRIRLSG